MPIQDLYGIFPNLKGTQPRKTSDDTLDYNCAGWAIDDRHWWQPWEGTILPSSQPQYYWPDNLPRNADLNTYVRFFEQNGFERTTNSSVEQGYEKIAIYERAGEFRHVARQKKNGRWSSKLGSLEDISHELIGLEGDHHEYSYGVVSVFMRRVG